MEHMKVPKYRKKRERKLAHASKAIIKRRRKS
jgi:hypothetical protein